MRKMEDRANIEYRPWAAIIWRGYELPGHEACRLFHQAGRWHIEGTAVFTHAAHPCLLSYRIKCDEGWRTRSAEVVGWLGDWKIGVLVRVDAHQRWWMNHVEVPAVAGCIDLDLNFSPSTNTIALRRLNMAVGDQHEITAAWLRFPSFALEPLPQTYQRLEQHRYHYESGGGQFVADLVTDNTGFVIDYPGIWQAEAFSGK